MLDELGAEGRTIVVVDHDPGFVASCCERVVCMNFGAVLVTGPPDEVLASDEVRRSYSATAPECRERLVPIGTIGSRGWTSR